MKINLSDLNQVLQAAERSSWDSVHIKYGDVEIRLGTAAEVSAVGGHEPSQVPNLQLEVSQVTPDLNEAEVVLAVPDVGAAQQDVGGEILPSPMLGTFWASPNPSEPPFVTAGDEVKKGQKLCIIEVMKLMTEVTAPHDGRVTHVFPGNGDLLEFGDPIFRIDAS